MKRLLTLLLAATALGACAPPQESTSTSAKNDDQTIRLGAYVALTGGQAAYGQAVRDGVRFAVDEINAAGGVLGKKVEVIVEDTQGKPEEAAAVVTKLITSTGVAGVIGETGSSRSLAAAPICQANKVPMVSPASTDPSVTKKGTFIFRICFTDDYQGRAIAKFARESLKLGTAAVLRDVKSDYSVGLARVFSEEFTRLGGRIVADQSYSEGDSDFRAQLTAIRATQPQAIFIPGYYTEIGQIAIQARDLGMKMPLLGGDGWDSPKLLEIGGKNLDGCFFASERAADESFRKRFQEKFGREAETLNAQGYDAAAVLIDAIRRAGSIEGDKVREALATTRDFAGATGKITIGPDRDPIKPVALLAINSGKVELREWILPQ